MKYSSINKKNNREKNFVSLQKNLTLLKSLKNFPVFMGVTKKSPKFDKTEDMNWYIDKKYGSVQLKPVLPLKIVYNSTHTSGTVGKLWDRHHQQFANFLNSEKIKKVFEIGGAKGILAEKFFKLKKKIPWTIIEPNPHPIKNCRAKFIKGFYNDKIGKKYSDCHFVHSHVFEHVYDPNSFMRMMMMHVKKGHKVIFSIPNMRQMLIKKYSNFLNFEHTYYLNEKLCEFLLKKYGFKILKKKYFLKDHSIFYSTVNLKKPNNKISFKNEYKLNKKLFKNYFSYYQNISSKINEVINKTQKPVYLFGAHIFSQYLINFGLNQRRIVNILDNDKLKQNKRLYGTNLIVKSPEILKKINSPLVILKAGVYNEEIKKQLTKLNRAITVI